MRRISAWKIDSQQVTGFVFGDIVLRAVIKKRGVCYRWRCFDPKSNNIVAVTYLRTTVFGPGQRLSAIFIDEVRSRRALVAGQFGRNVPRAAAVAAAVQRNRRRARQLVDDLFQVTVAGQRESVGSNRPADSGRRRLVDTIILRHPHHRFRVFRRHPSVGVPSLQSLPCLFPPTFLVSRCTRTHQ